MEKLHRSKLFLNFFPQYLGRQHADLFHNILRNLLDSLSCFMFFCNENRLQHFIGNMELFNSQYGSRSEKTRPFLFPPQDSL